MKLADIDGAALATASVEQVASRIAKLGMRLAPHYETYVGPSPRASAERRELAEREVGTSCDLALTVRQLVTYAQTGEPGDWQPAAGDVCDAVQGLVECGLLDVPDADDESDDTLALVVAAAYARAAIESREDVSRAQLAALAGVGVKRLDALTGTGRKSTPEYTLVRTGHGTLSHESARAWLAARGVPGFRGEK